MKGSCPRRQQTRAPVRGLVALLLLVGSASAGPPLPTPELREFAFRDHRRLPPLDPPAPLATQADFDVLEYDLTIWLDVAGERVEGVNLVTFEVVPGAGLLDELVLDLHSGNMTVTEVMRGRDVIDLGTVTHQDDVLRIPLDPPMQERDRPETVAITYLGQPRELSFGTLTFATHGDPPAPIVFSLAEPFLARGWWPCKDLPDDKATITLRVEAPEELLVASNGTQLWREAGRAGHAVTTWEESYPISTYLVSLAVSDYEVWEDTYRAPDGTLMPIRYWTYPERAAAAREDWSPTVPMMEFFVDAFYDYPFIDEKYGHAMIPMRGAMEHQTATSYGADVVTGDHRFDFIVAHELAHHWWGDHVGPRTFDSIWLNEGFATYSEALWWEHENGLGGYLDYMRSMDPVQQGRGDFPGTVHAPSGYFNSTVYKKGAWVLHMLRWVLGQPSTAPDPEAILPLLRTHGAAHSYGNASTDDFLATTNDVSGRDMAWFFDQWVHRAGRPDYQVGWAAAPQSDGTFDLHVRVRQTQAGAPYSMPVMVRVVMPSDTLEQVVDNASDTEDHVFPGLAEVPSAVQWDPNGWVLKRVATTDVDLDDDGWVDWLDGCPEVPNPGQEDADGDGVQDACQVGLDFDGDGVENQEDCDPADGAVWTPVLEDTTLFLRHAADGTVVLSFEGPDTLGQRAAVQDLRSGSLGDLLADRSTDGGACLVVGHAEPELADPQPTDGTAYWYLAFPWNGCLDDAGEPASPCR